MRFLVPLFLLSSSWASAQDQQVGARTKAMGGSYTAFEDDPVSVWLNPAGIATQPDGVAVVYQTYTIYEPFTKVEDGLVQYPGESGWTDPAIVPSYLAVTIQLGDAENPHAIGFCFTAPFRLKFGYLEDGIVEPENNFVSVDQYFYRIRSAYACDFRIKPPGGAGFLTHIAVGAGLDINITNWTYTKMETLDLDPGPLFDPGPSYTFTVSASDMRFGFGAGLLAGLYDNGRDLKVNLGLAFQSRASYKFAINFESVPLSDWPSQYQAGLTFYMFEGFPLRITIDAQQIQWNSATDDSKVAGLDNFENAKNLSLGFEYRFNASRKITLYPRMGLRLYNAPWTDEDHLPAIGDAQLDIETRGSRFFIFSAGLGVGWVSETGKPRSFDIAFDIGGEVPGVALGYNMEF